MVNPIQLHQAGAAAAPRPVQPGARPAPTSFSRVLEEQVRLTRDVRFSAHAVERLTSRGITISTAEQAQIRDAVDQVALKGARETLLLMDRLALIVSVPNRTVITAVPYDQLEHTVFTNIDSAVVVAEKPSPPSQE